jgi:hypothetical protein
MDQEGIRQEDVQQSDNELDLIDMDSPPPALDSRDEVETVMISKISKAEIDEDDVDDADFGWNEEKEIIIEPTERLEGEQRAKFEKMRKTLLAMNVFAHSLKDLGRCTIGEYKIEVTTDKPVFRNPYPKSPAERKIINEHLDELEKAGMIEKSTSPWSAPMMLISKKDKKDGLRPVIDFRGLNSVTVPMAFPVPKIESILDEIAQCVWISTFDLKSSYFQVKMDQKSIEYTGFSSPDAHYHWLVCPMGARNAVVYFCSLMRRILCNVKNCVVYLDDICCYTKTFDEHVQTILEVFRTLERYNLKLNVAKAVYFAKELTLLGFKVSGQKISIDERKVEAISKMAPPKNQKEVQRYLGVINYYRTWIP